MRAGYTHEQKGLLSNRLIDSDLHRFIITETEQSSNLFGVGLSTQDVRAMKKRLERN